jgi:regulator of sirC expression with transglutaminase-like and TPR domain
MAFGDGPEAVSDYLAAIGAAGDGDIQLAEAALALAAVVEPGTAAEPYRQHLGGIAARLRDGGGIATAAGRAAALRDTLAGHFRYAGDSETYDDLANANLMRVIDRRKGLPAALGILYIDAARRQGWAAEGVNFPGHFLVRVGAADGQVALDPFDGGKIIDAAGMQGLLDRQGAARDMRPDDVAALGNRDILLRLQNNIKLRALAQGQGEHAVAVLGSMLLIAPDRSGLWYECAAAMGELGHIADAIRAAERAAQTAVGKTDRAEALALAVRLKRRLN